MVPLHQGMFGQPSQSLVGMDSQSSALGEKWKTLRGLKKAHNQNQVLNIIEGIKYPEERQVRID